MNEPMSPGIRRPLSMGNSHFSSQIRKRMAAYDGQVSCTYQPLREILLSSCSGDTYQLCNLNFIVYDAQSVNNYPR
jgi:hypothetical protein